MLSKSQQYRRLLKMHGASASAATQPRGDGVLSLRGEEQPVEQPAERGTSGAPPNDGCQTCQFVVQYVKVALANNQTAAQIMQSLDAACETFSLGSGGEAGASVCACLRVCGDPSAGRRAHAVVLIPASPHPHPRMLRCVQWSTASPCTRCPMSPCPSVAKTLC